MHVMRASALHTAVALSICCLVVLIPVCAVSSTAIVINTDDIGPGSLRDAIVFANANPGTTIAFNIPITDAGYADGVFTIKPASALPDVTANGTIIDGFTQTVFTGDTNTSGPEIVLNGSLAGTGVSGITITSANCAVRSMVINGFSLHGIVISGSGATGNAIEGDYVGTNASGSAAVPNQWEGISVVNAASNTIGGLSPGVGNLLSGNRGSGIGLWESGTTNTTIQGNKIGTNAGGTAAIGNSDGVQVRTGASNNTIGGTAAGTGNLISGNTWNGISIWEPGTSGNLVQGNKIGAGPDGTVALANGSEGVAVGSGASNNTIGGTAAGAGNLISGNEWNGVGIGDLGTSANMVQGNKIGTTLDGTASLANSGHGVAVGSRASGNTIGGTAAGAGNLVSGNAWSGIGIWDSGTNGNLVQGNRIGASADGSTAVPNQEHGISIGGSAFGNVIGGTAPGAGNVISGNASHGVYVGGTDTISNVVRGNSIRDNGGMGINLDGGTQDSCGVTANHAGVVSGPNKLQNYPELTRVVSADSGCHVSGFIQALPNTRYTLEAFLNQTADPSGYGEGENLVATWSVDTGPDGVAYFGKWVYFTPPDDYCITMTATDVDGNTSEFSHALSRDASACVLTIRPMDPAQGSTTPYPGVHTYASGTVVSISAIQGVGHAFDKWLGNVADPLAASTTVTMTESKTVTACFRTDIADAKRKTNTTPVTITNAVLTHRVSPMLMYVETPDRSSGILIKGSNNVQEGVPTLVTVSGTMATLGSGERYVNATSISTLGGSTVKPVMMMNKHIGGGDWYFSDGSTAGQKGIWDNIENKSMQPNNIGLLIATTGCITYADPGGAYFYIDDGTGLDDGSGHAGIKVLGSVPVPDPLPPGWTPEGHHAVVTGISSCYQVTTSQTRQYRQIWGMQVVLAD